MKILLEAGQWIGGLSLVALAIGSLWIPKALGWKDKIAALSPLMRELWWTYSIYVWSSHVFFAVLLLGHGEWLMSGAPSALAMSVFIFLWWAVRLWLQFFGFDFAEIADTPFHRIAKHLLTALFAGLVVLFGALISWNAGWLPPAPFP